MTPIPHADHNWAHKEPSTWKQFRGYSARWVLFCLVTSLYPPVADEGGDYWMQKFTQGLMGLLFGAGCAIVFTLAENTLNAARIKWRSWALVISTWFFVKVAFVSIISATGT